MEEKYYLAERSCSRGIHQRSLLRVCKDEIDFHRGPTDDRFKLENGRPVCTIETGGLPYHIIGPLSDADLDTVIEVGIWGDFTKQKRIHSERQATSVFGGNIY